MRIPDSLLPPVRLAAACAAVATLDCCLWSGIRAALPSSDSLLLTGLLRLIEVLILAIVYRRDLVSITGAAAPRAAARQAAVGLAVAAVGGAAWFSAAWLLPATGGPDLARSVFGPPLPPPGLRQAAVYLAVGCLAGPLAEEFFFRGVLVHALRGARDGLRDKLLWDPLLIALFVAPHVLLGPSLSAAFILSQAAVWGSCALVTLRLRDATGGILAGFVVHGAANACIFLVGHGLL